MAFHLPSLRELRNTEFEILKFQNRVLVLQGVVLVCFVLLGIRLFYLQVIRHEDLLAQAENNRTAVLPTVPNRGTILDRNGVVLANNYSAYTLEITPSRMRLKRLLSRKGMSMISDKPSMVASKSLTREGVISRV